MESPKFILIVNSELVDNSSTMVGIREKISIHAKKQDSWAIYEIVEKKIAKKETEVSNSGLHLID